MSTPISDDQFERLAQQIEPGSRLLHQWSLKGGVSARVTALELLCVDGQTKKLVIRQHGANDFASNPQIAADEYRLLQYLHTAGLAVPRPYYHELPSSLFPHGLIAVEYINGSPIATLSDAQIQQFARYLAQLHELDQAALHMAFLPQYLDRHAPLFSQASATDGLSIDERRILHVLASGWPWPQHHRLVVLHGDYWPGNALWSDGQLRAVIDWEDATIGDPLVDLANCRLELLWVGGIDMMEQFTHVYQSLISIDLTNLPLWELCTALRPVRNMATWGLEPQTEQRMRAVLELFIERAIAQLRVL